MELFSQQAVVNSTADIAFTQALMMILIQIPYLYVAVRMLRQKNVISEVV
jgi:hypothetical protein